MPRFTRLLGAAACLGFLLLLSTPLHSQILNKNLIVNGDAEAGPAVQNATDAQVSSVPGWTITGGFSAGKYNGGNFPADGDYLPVVRGKQFFYGGPGTKTSTAVQVVDLSAGATTIDTGTVKFYLSGYLGFVSGSYDSIYNTWLRAEFQDASGNNILVATANAASVADVSVPDGLFFRATSGFLPPNVRKAKVTINLSTGDTGYNGFAADNISLVLTSDPLLGVNLLQNGDAETNPQNEDGYPVPGWDADTFMCAWKYGDYKMPLKSEPGPTDRGTYFLACPSNHDQCRAYQTVDFTTASKLVDAGKVMYTLEGWFGGDTGYPDNADMTVTFFNASGGPVGSPLRIGPVTNADRNGQRGLLMRSTSATMPSGARSARVDLYFHKQGPVTDNLDAYADSLRFQLDAIQITGVTNAASSQTGAVAPGEFVSIYGNSLGPQKYQVAVGSQKGLGSTRVTFNGIEAFLTFTSATQVNALVPYGVTGKSDVVVTFGGQTSDPFPLSLTEASPGIFTQAYGGGQAWAVNNDGSFNASSNPVARGGYISFWATGQGVVSPTGVDGELVSGYKNILLPVKVTIGGQDAQILGAVLIYTGEIQVNAMIPSSAPTGDVPLVLTIGTTSSRKDVTVAVK
jgi:uncharacterized protein (TIGR03437 family)